MAITIDGDGAITGLSAGGLPNNSVQTADIADDQITLAKLAGGTDGQIITYDASGNPVAVGPGSTGQVLTSTGTGSPPAFAAAAAGGKVLQVVTGTTSTETSVSSTTWTDSTLTCDITTTHASNKVLAFVSQHFSTSEQGAVVHGGIALLRGSTIISLPKGPSWTTQIRGFLIEVGANGTNWIHQSAYHNLTYLDAPGSAATHTYKTQQQTGNAGMAVYTQTWSNPSYITLMELDYS